MDFVIVAAAWILNPRARRRRQRIAELESGSQAPASPSSENMTGTDTSVTIIISSPLEEIKIDSATINRPSSVDRQY